MKIVCPGGYTWNNKGDAALVLAMLGELRRVAPLAEIVVVSDSPRLDATKYGVPVVAPLYGATLEYSKPSARRLQPGQWATFARQAFGRYVGWRIDQWLDAPMDVRRYGSRRELIRTYWERTRFHVAMAWLYICISIAGRRSYLLVPGEKGVVLKQFCEADQAVFVPGGYFIAPHAAHTYWFRHVAALLACRWLGLPVSFYACTVGPFFDKYNYWLAFKVLNHPYQIYVRERASYDVLQRIAPRARTQLTADAGFLLPSCSPEQIEELHERLIAKDGRRKIGISVRDYRFPGHPDPVAQRQLYLEAMARTVEHVVDRLGMTAYFVPQVLADEVNDVVVSQQVIALLHSTNHVHLLNEDLDPRDLKGLYSCFDLFIGVRMHANIFALSSGVPTVAIAYEPKTEGIMQQLGLGEYAVSIRKVNPMVLIELVDRLNVDAQLVREKLVEAIPKIQREAMKTADSLQSIHGD